jgi:hypothetical protein
MTFTMKIPFPSACKGQLRLKTPGVYSMPCECDQVYNGQTGHFIETSVKKQHVHLQQPDKLAMAEHNTNFDHNIQLQNTTILSTTYMGQMIREANETEFHPNNMNRKEDLFLNQSWPPLNHSIK